MPDQTPFPPKPAFTWGAVNEQRFCVICPVPCTYFIVYIESSTQTADGGRWDLQWSKSN
jgi:hypothetical protein